MKSILNNWTWAFGIAAVAVAFTLQGVAQIQTDPALEPDYNISRAALGSGLLYISDVVVESDSPDPLLNDKVDLIHDDETLTSDLPLDRSLFVIRLKDASIVNSFRFYNFGAAGSVSAYARPTTEEEATAGETQDPDGGWVQVSESVSFGEPGPVVVWFDQEIEAKLVRIVFDTTKSDIISGFGVAGTFFRGASPKQTQLVRQTQATDNTDLTNVVSYGSGARVIGTSGGMAPSDKAMIDDLVETSHVFPETNEEPVALFDLGEPREIERISALIDSPAPTRMEMYFLDDLDSIDGGSQPVALHTIQDGPLFAQNGMPSGLAPSGGSMTIINVPTSFFDQNDPNVVAEFEEGDRKARANVAGSSFAQYVLVRWVYENGVPADFTGLVVNELNFLGRYVWYYEGDPDAPAEGPDSGVVLTPTSGPPGNPPDPPEPPEVPEVDPVSP